MLLDNILYKPGFSSPNLANPFLFGADYVYDILHYTSIILVRITNYINYIINFISFIIKMSSQYPSRDTRRLDYLEISKNGLPEKPTPIPTPKPTPKPNARAKAKAKATEDASTNASTSASTSASDIDPNLNVSID
jgi:hypothetical protein